MKKIFVLILANFLAISLFAQGKDLGPITSLFTDYYAGRDSVVAKNTVYSVEDLYDDIYRLRNNNNKYTGVPAQFIESGVKFDVSLGNLISTDLSIVDKIFSEILADKKELELRDDISREIAFYVLVDSETGKIIEFRFFWLDGAISGQRNLLGCISPFEIEEIENRMKEEVVFDVSRFREIPPVNFVVKLISVRIKNGEIKARRPAL